MEQPHVGLFATCLVDLQRPNVGFATVKLLEASGCRVSVPERQTCCGQPAYNSGDTEDAKAIAAQVIALFEGFDYVVIPSGSCGGTIKDHYPKLFADDPTMGPRAQALADRTFELLSFLDQVRGYKPDSAYQGKITYHDSCSGLRELAIKQQPRNLLGEVEGLEIVEGKEAETCCGFGGLFCVKYPDISEKIVDKKVNDILETGADTLVGGDLGCLMNMAGRLSRRDAKIKVWHAAEILAGMADGAPLCSADKKN
ncbi:MAG: (Fe-S)-binding protein [Magnetovibrionaceae bacterium]